MKITRRSCGSDITANERFDVGEVPAAVPGREGGYCKSGRKRTQLLCRGCVTAADYRGTSSGAGADDSGISRIATLSTLPVKRLGLCRTHTDQLRQPRGWFRESQRLPAPRRLLARQTGRASAPLSLLVYLANPSFEPVPV